MTYLAVLPVQQVGAMWIVLAADEIHLFPTAVDETANHDMRTSQSFIEEPSAIHGL